MAILAQAPHERDDRHSRLARIGTELERVTVLTRMLP